MARWFLVRHGETDWNTEGRTQGQTDTPLNDAGHAQAERLAARLAPATFAAAYSSDLRRVVDTARPILRGRDVSLIKMSELREKHFGEWEGITFQNLKARYPEQFTQMFSDDATFAPPGGETDAQLHDRVAAVAERLRKTHSGDDGDVLIVAHGGTLRALIVYLLRLPVDGMWRFRLTNTGLSIVSFFDDGSAVLDMMNDTGHLSEEV